MRMAYGIYYDQASMIQQNNSNDVAPFSCKGVIQQRVVR